MRTTRTAGPSNDSVESPLEMYLREIHEIPMLDHELEIRLGEQIADGSVEARKQMAQSSLRLVVTIARDFEERGLDLLDLIQEGNTGLLRAVEGYDHTMGTRFSTYASYWIKKAIRQAIINATHTINVPAYMMEIITRYKRTETRLKRKGKPHAFQDVADMLEIPEKERPCIREALLIVNMVRRTDRVFLEETLRDKKETQDIHELQDDIRHMRAGMGKLRTQEQDIVRMHYGLDGGEPHILEEIGNAMGITKERVRQIKSSGIGRLQRHFHLCGEKSSAS